jgi:hypothetical protein
MLQVVRKFNKWFDNLKEPGRIFIFLGFLFPLIIFYNLALFINNNWFYLAGVYLICLLMLRYKVIKGLICKLFHWLKSGLFKN